MALTESKVIDQITVLEDGQIQVREATVLSRDGEELTRTFHRHVVPPGADLTKEDARVKKVGDVIHTAAVKQAFAANQQQPLDTEAVAS